MVPGIIERERLAVELKHREWLAESALEAARSKSRVDRGLAAALAAHSVRLGLWRRCATYALALGQRTRLTHPPQGAAMIATATRDPR